MACYLSDDPYRTSAKNYAITQLTKNINHLVYSPDPSTKLANICGIITRHTKVKEEEPKENKEPADFPKLAKYGMFHCFFLFAIFILLRFLLSYSGQNDEQRTVALWLFCSLGCMIYCMIYGIW